jgi:hypothetical protein
VCEGFIYSEDITRCTVRQVVWGLEVVVRDKKVLCVQALRTTTKHVMNIGRIEQPSDSGSYRPLVLYERVMAPLVLFSIRSRELSEQ